jgi:hypothetical protein
VAFFGVELFVPVFICHLYWQDLEFDKLVDGIIFPIAGMLSDGALILHHYNIKHD